MSNGSRVFIVEDEPVVALDIKIKLDRKGYLVTGVASSGEQAIESVRNLLPDLILMDIKLKGKMDGIEAAQHIHTFSNVPIVYLTAFADEVTLQRAKLTEPYGYILKPFEERELITNIEISLYKHEMEKALQEREERYSLALQGSNDGIWDWDLTTNIIFFSRRWKTILGYQDNEIGSTLEVWFDLIHPEDLEKFRLLISSMVHKPSSHLEIEHRMVHKSGELLWVLTRGAAISKNGKTIRAAGSMTDITFRKRAEEQALFEALHDKLTGLPNRALFLDRVGQSIERIKLDQDRQFAVLHLDLDRLKVINDSFGHQVGDEVLINVGQLLRAIIRTTDTVARIGGDEFAILLDDFSNSNYLREVVNRILDILKQPIIVNDLPVFSTACIGIVQSDMGYERAEVVLRDAEIAVHRAKALGAGQYHFIDFELRRQALSHLELEHALRGALDRHEYRLQFQPIINLETGKISSFEALLRWSPAQLPDISIPEIIEALEESGQIIPVGEWVLEEACRQLSQWQAKYPLDPPLAVSVNFSVKQLSAGCSVEQIQQILKKFGIQPGQLKLEITESLFLENPHLITQFMMELNEIGVEIHIDDFGTGYSSLSYLEKLPFHTIKIDQSFLQRLEINETREILHTIIQLAHKLGMLTTAEGIEYHEQLEKVKEMGCNFGQGFLFSKPLEPIEVEQLILEQFESQVISQPKELL